jgi:hypothetical protein
MILGSCILTEIARRATTSRMEESYIQKKKPAWLHAEDKVWVAEV